MEKLTKILILISLMSFQNFIVKAQVNLVPNPSFEEYTNCPEINPSISITFVQDWYTPTNGSPDYFNACSSNTSGVGVPQAGFGYQNARTGVAYAGFGSGTDFLREYIQCQLANPLKSGTKYKVLFNVSRADTIPYGCDNIGAYLSPTAVSSSDDLRLPYTPQVVSDPNRPIMNDTDWVQISDIVTATGGEQFLTIGVFASDADIYGTGGVGQIHYYYVDDVSVIQIIDTSSTVIVYFEMPTAFSPNGDNVNDTYYPVYFDSSLKVKEFRIYNMWGEIVHNDPLIPWDGTYKGQPQPSNVYSYYVYIDLPVPDNISQIKSYHKAGSFTLLR
jgi:gliding motility-associated-like protein